MKLKLTIASVIILFSAGTFAATVTPKPAKCPSISAIKSVGVNAARTFENIWIAYQASNTYDTSDSWFFGVSTSATNANDAIVMGNQNINKLKLYSGPDELEHHAGWS